MRMKMKMRRRTLEGLVEEDRNGFERELELIGIQE
jgi:hypothetical protein